MQLSRVLAYSLHQEGIESLVEHCLEVMDLRHMDKIFCTSVQFGEWYPVLLSQKEDVLGDEPVQGEEGVFQKTLTDVNKKPLPYTGAPGNYSSDPRSEQISHTPRDNTAVNFRSTDFRHTDMLKRLFYQAPRYILSHQQQWNSEMNNIPRSQRFEIVHGADVAASGRCLMLRLGQESVGWMLDLVARFCAPADLMHDYCLQTIAKPNQCGFGLTISALQDVLWMKEICTAARVFIAEMNEVQVKRKEDVLNLPECVAARAIIFQEYTSPSFIVQSRLFAVSKLPPYSTAPLVSSVVNMLLLGCSKSADMVEVWSGTANVMSFIVEDLGFAFGVFSERISRKSKLLRRITAGLYIMFTPTSLSWWESVKKWLLQLR